MKTKYCLFVALTVIFNSCEKDNSKNCEENSKYYRIEKSIHCLQNGYLFFEGPWLNFDSAYLFNLMLTSDEVNFDLIDSIFSGKGDALTFSVLCKTSEIFEGTYNLYRYTLPAFIGAGHYENYDFAEHYRTNDSDNLPGSFVNIANGYFSISEDINDTYSINYACKDEFGDSITGKYIGNLIYIDSSN